MAPIEAVLAHAAPKASSAQRSEQIFEFRATVTTGPALTACCHTGFTFQP